MLDITPNNLFQLTDAEEKTLARVIKKLDLEKVFNHFYEDFLTQPSYASYFEGFNLENLGQKLVAHWQGLLDSNQREKTLQNAGHVGKVHEQLGVRPEFYLSAYSFLFESLMDQANAALPPYVSRKERRNVIAAISKILMADVSASIAAYIEKQDESLINNVNSKNVTQVIDRVVNISTAMNHLFVDSLKASNLAVEVDQKVQSISAAIEEMTTTVSVISENTKKANEYTRQTSTSATEGAKIAKKAVETMKSASAHVEGTKEKADRLAESSKRMEGIITQIQDIAEQTNLLALNATIEAARAGDAGKGFAVVANEVKSLSNETGQATQEIAEIITTFVDSIQEILSSMTQVTEAVSEGRQVTEDVSNRMQEIEQNANLVSERMGDISSALNEQNTAATEISEASVNIMQNSKLSNEMSNQNATLSRKTSENVTQFVAEMSGSTEITGHLTVKLAKSDHITWFRQMAELLFGSGGLDESQLKDHSQCRLGQWYYTRGKEALASEEAFQRLEEPHRKIHAIGREVFNHHKAGEREKALEKLGEMEQLSHEVVSILDEIDEICGRLGTC